MSTHVQFNVLPKEHLCCSHFNCNVHAKIWWKGKRRFSGWKMNCKQWSTDSTFPALNSFTECLLSAQNFMNEIFFRLWKLIVHVAVGDWIALMSTLIWILTLNKLPLQKLPKHQYVLVHSFAFSHSIIITLIGSFDFCAVRCTPKRVSRIHAMQLQLSAAIKVEKQTFKS